MLTLTSLSSKKPCQNDLKEVETALVYLAALTNLNLPSIPAHGQIQENEQQERLAKEGGQLDPEEWHTSSADEMAIII